MSPIYYPRRLTQKDRQVNCNCLCHERVVTEHGEGPCFCKVGGWHEEVVWG